MFMDALCSSAVPTSKANVKKRKRLASANSKDGSPPPGTPESPKIVAAPMKFYQDTLESENNSEGPESPTKKSAPEDKDNETPESPAKDEAGDDPKSPSSPDKGDPKSPSGSDEEVLKKEYEDMDEEEDPTPKPPGPGCGPDGPPGVLVIHRRRPAKKSVRWRPQEQLEEVRLFELDETERVNVTKNTFTDMKQMERFGERDAFQMARKLQSEDLMVEQMPWMALIEVDDVPVTADGAQSQERGIQAARELTCLQALYFNYSMIPDSPAEPDAEPYKYVEPPVIPLEDATNTVNDFRKQGWPEPKEHGPSIFNGLNGMLGGGGAFENPFVAGPFAGANGMPPFAGNNGVWANGGPGGPPFGPNVPPPFMGTEDQIKLAMNRLAFPGQTFNAPNFNGINPMNLPAIGAGGPMGGPPAQGGPWGGVGGGGFRPPMGGMGGPIGGGGGVWRGPGPNNSGGPRNDWTSNNGNSRPCKNHRKGFCKNGDRCKFSHAMAPGGGGGGYNRS